MDLIGRVLLASGCVLWLVGCATYHPLPLDREAERKALSPPSMATIKVEAAKIRHPLLKPIDFDINDGLSPGEAAVMAVLANPGLRALRDARGIARAQLLEAGVLPNPVFSYNRDTPTTSGNYRNKVVGYGMGLEWMVSALFTRSQRRKGAQAAARSISLTIAWREWRVAEAAKLQVRLILLLKKELLPARQREALFLRMLTAVRDAAGHGALSRERVEAASVAWERSRQAYLSLLRLNDMERHGLNRLLGLSPGEKVRLQENRGLPALKKLPPEKDLVNGLPERRLDLLALREGYASQNARLRAAIRAQFPAIVIGLTHLRDTDNVVTNGYSVSIGLPVFDRNQGRIAGERATRRKLYDEYCARLFCARAEVSRLLATMKISRRRLAVAEGLLPGLSRIAKAYRAAFDDGDVSLLKLTRVENDVWSQEIAVYQLRSKSAELETALELASGRYFAAPEKWKKSAQTGMKEVRP